jgi:3-oxoacyl-[acyl-carrier protein] reductase
MPRDEFDKVLAITVGGTFTTMKEAATRLRAGGRVINFSSTSLYLALPGYAAYNAAKAAVEAMTKVLSKEFAGRNITVNTVAPGPVATELFYTGKTPETVERMARLSPLGRLGQVDDVVPVVRFLCHPDSSWVSGQTIRVNGAVG